MPPCPMQSSVPALIKGLHVAALWPADAAMLLGSVPDDFPQALQSPFMLTSNVIVAVRNDGHAHAQITQPG